MIKDGELHGQKKQKDKGVLEYVSVKNRKNVKALIRDLGLELVSVTVSKMKPYGIGTRLSRMS